MSSAPIFGQACCSERRFCDFHESRSILDRENRMTSSSAGDSVLGFLQLTSLSGHVAQVPPREPHDAAC